jgi:hypothetical protein
LGCGRKGIQTVRSEDLHIPKPITVLYPVSKHLWAGSLSGQPGEQERHLSRVKIIGTGRGTRARTVVPRPAKSTVIVTPCSVLDPERKKRQSQTSVSARRRNALWGCTNGVRWQVQVSELSPFKRLVFDCRRDRRREAPGVMLRTPQNEVIRKPKTLLVPHGIFQVHIRTRVNQSRSETPDTHTGTVLHRAPEHPLVLTTFGRSIEVRHSILGLSCQNGEFSSVMRARSRPV